MGLSLFIRMRDLAFQDPTLNGIFGPTMDSNKFRWFNTQLPQGQVGTLPGGKTCAFVLTVSQATYNLHGSVMRNPLNRPRVQIAIADPSPTKADDAAAAVCNFLDQANFVKNGAFASPPVTDPPGTNVKLSERGGFLTYQTGIPIPVVLLDYWIYNVNPT